MSSIHAIRAKKWKTNPFLAEWLANAFDYYQTREGKRAFEVWLVKEYGKEKAREKLLDCQKAPRKKYGTSTGNVGMFNSAAFELGISDECMIELHLFTAGTNICVPPRVKPAVKRRRGESSAEWLARRHESLLNGCKVPDIDWRIARAMAVSEFDKARDTFEALHADLPLFLETIFRRSHSTLINPDLVASEPEHVQAFHRMDYAFRSTLHAVTLAYMTWGHAVDIFDELARRGLHTTSAIERAYKQDSALMWRLVTCDCRISYLEGHLWERFTEVTSWCEYFRPYFSRYRTPNGSSRIKLNHLHLKQQGGYATLLDNVVIPNLDTDSSLQSHGAFFDPLLKCLDKDPSEAKKFSPEAYQDLGDLATVEEFRVQMSQSAFGTGLKEYATSRDSQCRDDPHFWRISTFMAPSKIDWVERNSNDWTYARTVARSLGSTWLATTSKMSMWEFFRSFRHLEGPSQVQIPFIFDLAWKGIGAALWDLSKSLDRPGESGTVARKFGLFDPADRDRPSCIETMLKQIQDRTPPPLATPRKTPVPKSPANPIHFAAQESSPVVSGHAYVAGTNHLRAKEKIKTKAAVVVVENAVAAEEEEEESPEDLPDVLPDGFKIGKKVLKIFHQVLAAPNEPLISEEAPGAKKGQIRWVEFERAMKRIGFGVVQTAGSSVRFDPPATTARPITFHRPHPDSILTPMLQRWIGARLKRCYGWTTATFQRGQMDEE
ncbi:hypothetical protein C8J57DRAFT_1316058 [Mycena rebaudengoi]|nr:hypothetical protein C8J57DRAFT_1316058 [Mycena rebaudengoi]